MEVTRLSHSSLETFSECPRRYFYRYVLEKEPVSDRASLSFGRLLHGALERWWGEDPEAAVKFAAENVGDMDPVNAARMAAMLTEYAPPRDRYKVVAVELPFDAPVKNPDTKGKLARTSLVGRVDALVEDAAGNLWILEHKHTTRDIVGFGDYWARLAFDQQNAIYAAQFGAVGVLYDVLRKPSLRQTGKESIDQFQERCIEKIRETPGEWYQFREIHFGPVDHEQSRRDVYQKARLLAVARKNNYWPRTSSACNSLYGSCAFVDVCAGRALIDDADRFRSRTRAA